MDEETTQASQAMAWVIFWLKFIKSILSTNIIKTIKRIL